MNREHEGAVRGSPTARDGGAYRACRAVVPVARIQPRPSLTEPPGGVSPRTEAVPTRLWGGARRTGVPRRGKGVLVPHKGERPTAPYPRNHTRSIQTWVGSVSPHNGCGFDEYLARGRSRIPWVRSAIRRIEIQHTTGSTEPSPPHARDSPQAPGRAPGGYIRRLHSVIDWMRGTRSLG